MDYFPIFLRLSGEPVLVVGGGPVAARKVELLLRSAARVTVVAPVLCERLQALRDQGAIEHRAEAFSPAAIDGKRLVIAATDSEAVNAWVARFADSRHIPVNVVDDRKLSRFIMPAIVDRSPVIVAVGSSGDAPVLTRRLREKIETLLPERLGRLAAVAGRLRGFIKARVPDGASRRKFWERFFDGPLAANVLSGRGDVSEAQLEQQLPALLAEINTAETGQGEVALVGAGPGDPGLLTLRGLRALQNADVILYDRLVSEEILDLARRDAERIYVGKAAGQAHRSQDEINAMLVQYARAGKRVCRLKGGDPFVFGRGGEELEALAAAGIRFEVVPGITAATGCAAYAGIPLTHRNYAQSLTLVTGHCKDETERLDWALLAQPDHTAVFYMGLSHLPAIVHQLMAHGAPRERAAALVEDGTRASQRVIAGTLADLPSLAQTQGVKSPALLIVGEVTRLHEVLHWFNSTSPTPAMFAREFAAHFANSSEGRRSA
jgi:uroporphyrin-III C-methyltransferase/precorrin-2 dehydrogenase/sirohydrochlorin ferrochelatase